MAVPARCPLRWDESYGGEDAFFSVDARAAGVRIVFDPRHRRRPRARAVDLPDLAASSGGSRTGSRGPTRAGLLPATGASRALPLHYFLLLRLPGNLSPPRRRPRAAPAVRLAAAAARRRRVGARARLRYAAGPPPPRGRPSRLRVSVRPILVTGAHRSGTTWVGKMLALAPGVGYIHEPFSPATAPGISGAPFDRYFPRGSPPRTGALPARPRATLAFRYASRAARGAPHAARRAAPAATRSPSRAPAYAARGRSSRIRSRSSPRTGSPIASTWTSSSRSGIPPPSPQACCASAGVTISRSFAATSGCGRFEAELRRPGDPLEQAALLWRILYSIVDDYRGLHPELDLRPPRGRGARAARDLRAALRAARARADAAGAADDRACERRRQPGDGVLTHAVRARQRSERKAVAHAAHRARGRTASRPHAGRVAALLRRRRLVAEPRERRAGAAARASATAAAILQAPASERLRAWPPPRRRCARRRRRARRSRRSPDNRSRARRRDPRSEAAGSAHRAALAVVRRTEIHVVPERDRAERLGCLVVGPRTASPCLRSCTWLSENAMSRPSRTRCRKRKPGSSSSSSGSR